MKLTRSSLAIVVDGRCVTVSGEAFLPGHGSPDFIVYSDTIVRWDDGGLVDGDARVKILAQIQEEAQQQGVTIDLE